jgi:hypothetical protein
LTFLIRASGSRTPVVYIRTGPINTHHRNLSVIFMQPRRTMPRKFSA